MISWSSGKLEEPFNRNNNANLSALKQDFLDRLDGAQPVYKTLQQLQELGQASGQLPSLLQQCSNLIYKLILLAELEWMIYFWGSRTLNVQPDAGWHHQGFHVLLPCSCATPPLQSLSAPVVCHQARCSEMGDASRGLPGALCQQGGSAACSWRNAEQSVRPVRVTPGKPAHSSPTQKPCIKHGPRLLLLLWSTFPGCHGLKHFRVSHNSAWI